MNIGLICREDSGGLAAQSLEFANNLPITSTLIVDLGERGRGATHPRVWTNPFYVGGPLINARKEVEGFLDGLDAVMTIETFYGPMVSELAASRRIATVRYANPELYKREGESHVVVPTNWQMSGMPSKTRIIPQGITMPPKERQRIRNDSARTLLHFTAPAMLDRNGTREFSAALLHTTARFDINVVGLMSRQRKHRQHRWHVASHDIPNRLDHYSDDVDLLVLPRRYAGLSLPMLEAASYGIPILTTHASPQSAWFPPDALIPSEYQGTIPMVGGRMPIYSANVPALAKLLDRYSRESLSYLSTHALSWAQTHSWERIKPIWIEYFNNL